MNLIIPAVNSQKCVKARALFDNIAEAPDELAFRKGDVLTVLEQNTASLEGWWLCTLRGRQGICPGNRLRLLPGQYDNNEGLFGTSLDDSQKQDKRRSWHVQSNKVITPQKYGDIFLYDLPTSRCSVVSSSNDFYLNESNDTIDQIIANMRKTTAVDDFDNIDCYDTPPKAIPVISTPTKSPATGYTVPKSTISSKSCVTPLDSYDVPRPSQALTPSSSTSSLTNDGSSLSGSNRSSITAADYDVPRSRFSMSSYQTSKILTSTQNNQQQQIYDIPINKVNLPLDPALVDLQKLESEVSTAITKLLSFVSPGWRTLQKLEKTLMEIKLACQRLRTSLHDLTEFAEGTLSNAAGKALSDKGLSMKLRPLVKALRDTDKLIEKAFSELDIIKWNTTQLCREENETNCSALINWPADPLDQLIACARVLTEDVRQVASFIQGNSTLLFKKQLVFKNVSTEDYDYVNLDSRDAVVKQREELREMLPQELGKNYDLVVAEADQAAIQHVLLSPMDPNDKQVLSFYAAQAITHGSHLTHAIDAFLQTVEHNQPPKVFLAHGKFVVLSAHRLVHIGDTVHRNVLRNDFKTRILQSSNTLNDVLAQTVTKIKQAAQYFPSVTAVQEMVDSVVDVSHMAKDLKLILIHAAQQP
ncbi:breast cancer anti-estrogen resistance protein 1 [Leptopilina heterotoma]|uniref:breast cancer anti-estrogen resistance protein 1 n=1 Tax=Leptopilina heterotoma TaxID=63436 RepID=UPI001CA8B3AC|nr:breast cancer anti-estrogen resistance protein 1 [Leptopilina heterotoma]